MFTQEVFQLHINKFFLFKIVFLWLWYLQMVFFKYNII
jgi:hypothetical protein